MIRCTMATKIKSVKHFQRVIDSLIPLEETKITVGIDSYWVTRIHPNLFARAWLCENDLSGIAVVFDNIELFDEKYIALLYENKRVARIEL